MAEIFLDNDLVHVVFGPLEKVGGLIGDATFPLDSVVDARVADNPFHAVKGIRAPGTGVPGVIALGTWRSRRHGRSLVAAYRARPALVLEVEGQSFQRVVVSSDEAAKLAQRLQP